MTQNNNPWDGVPKEYLSELALCPQIGLAGCSNTRETFQDKAIAEAQATDKRENYDVLTGTCCQLAWALSSAQGPAGAAVANGLIRADKVGMAMSGHGQKHSWCVEQAKTHGLLKSNYTVNTSTKEYGASVINNAKYGVKGLFNKCEGKKDYNGRKECLKASANAQGDAESWPRTPV